MYILFIRAIRELHRRRTTNPLTVFARCPRSRQQQQQRQQHHNQQVWQEEVFRPVCPRPVHRGHVLCVCVLLYILSAFRWIECVLAFVGGRGMGLKGSKTVIIIYVGIQWYRCRPDSCQKKNTLTAHNNIILYTPCPV